MTDTLTIKRRYDHLQFKKLNHGILFSYDDRVISLNDEDVSQLKEWLDANCKKKNQT